MNIPLSSPDITDLERQSVMAVLETPHLSLGPLLPRFEAAFAHYIGSRYAVAVNSGTSGLHLAIKALDIGEGDVVFTSPFSFVASANCILFEGAKPGFIDIDPITYNIDVVRMEKAIRQFERGGLTPKAILPVHVFGRPCDMDELMRVADTFGLTVIEDACEAIGSEYRGRRVGTFGEAGIFAFYPNKQITTGEGGIVVTDDEKITALCRSFRNQGRGENGGWLAHERLGYNYRLSEINCALGVAQLERIDEILAKRAKVAALYNAKLESVEEVHTPVMSEDATISWFVYVVRLADRYSRQDRDRILEGLRSSGIGCNNYFTPIHLQPFYREHFGFKEGDFPITEHVSERTIALPFYNNLTEEQIEHVVESLKRLLGREGEGTLWR
jgi:perosamine synthetase